MGTADWGIWTDPPAVKTASAQIPFSEYNNMIASGNLGYLITGLQNTSLGHRHDGRDSRGPWRIIVTAFDTTTVVMTNTTFTDVAGWSAVLTAPASAILRYHFWATLSTWNHWISGRAVVNGTAQSAPALGYRDHSFWAWEWLTAVPSGVVTVKAQLNPWYAADNPSATVFHKAVVAELFVTG